MIDYLSSQVIHLCLAYRWTHKNFVICKSPVLHIQSKCHFHDHFIYGLWCWKSCISSHLLLLALEDKPHIWKKVSSRKQDFPQKLALSPAILEEVPTVKSLAGAVWGGEHAECQSTAKVNSNFHSSRNLQSIWAFLNRSIQFFLIKSATQENALCILHGDSASSWPIV